MQNLKNLQSDNLYGLENGISSLLPEKRIEENMEKGIAAPGKYGILTEVGINGIE